MKTFCFKLYKFGHNKKLMRLINIAGLIFNHCIALHKRYYRLYGKYIHKYTLQEHITKLKRTKRFGYFWSRNIVSPDFFRLNAKIIRTKCRKLSPKKKGSGNFQQARLELARAYRKFVQILKHEAMKLGTRIIFVDRFYPSRQLCNVCGYRNKAVKDLKIREWDCPSCGTHHDRDRNAA